MAKVTDKDYYMDGYLKANLDFAIKAIREDDDWLLIIDGKERSGKSVLAQQVAYYVDPTINVDRITFSVNDWEEKINSAPQYSAVIWDEAFEGLSKRSFLSRVNKKIVNILMKCGQKNLFLILVMPTFFELDKYAVLHRSKALIHVHRNDKYKRGFYKFYNSATMRKMYIDGAKYYNYCARCNFPGYFTNTYCVDEEAYREKKRLDLDRQQEKEENNDILKQTGQRNMLIAFLNAKFYNNATKLHREVTEMYPEFDLSPRQMRDVVKEWHREAGGLFSNLMESGN